tara:strand:+ start:99 stop:404 length:306 start_codon:yes stop_codon:yes gene_type:complete
MSMIHDVEVTIKALNAQLNRARSAGRVARPNQLFHSFSRLASTIRSLCETLKNYQDLMDKIDALVPEEERNSDWEDGGTIEGLYEYIKNLREEAAELPDEE